MIPKKEVRDLVNELFPSISHRHSCKRCAKYLGYSFEYVYRTCLENSEYPVRRSFLKTLQAIKLVHMFAEINKELIKFDIRD